MIVTKGNKRMCVLRMRVLACDGGPARVSSVVRKKMLKEFGTPEIEEDGRKGHILWGNMLRLYHVKSVRPGIWVGCFGDLTPKQTRPVAREYLRHLEGS